MAQLQQPFNSDDHEEMADFSPLAAGEYVAHIKESEMKLTKNKQGQYLELVFSVDTPGFTSRQVWARLNLINQNATAVELANRELSSICKAIGVAAITDSNQLHGKPLIIKVKVNPATAQYSESNSIVAYKSAGSSPGPAPTQTPEKPAAMGTEKPAAASSDKPDWA